MNEDLLEPLWDKRRLASFLGVSVATVDQWVSRGNGGPRHLKVGALVRFRPDDVREFLGACPARTPGKHSGGAKV